jgi:hypothetical protein
MSTAQNKYDFPWEDTLILAFRDLQWRQKVDELMDYAKRLRAAVDDMEKHIALLQEKRQQHCPPLLAKLDGSAENATGDVITSTGTRFYLLEFKADLSKVHTEAEKFIYQLMNKLDLKDQVQNNFAQLSKTGHFFIYSTTRPATQGQTPIPDATMFGEGRALALTVQPYFNVARGIDPIPSDITTAEDLLQGKQGWTFTQMLVYLKILALTHKKTTGSEGHPMKVAIVTQNGLFWPFGDLSDVLAMTNVFQQTLKLVLREHIDTYKKEGKALKPLVEPMADAVKQALITIKEQKEARKNKQVQDGNHSLRAK